MHTNVRYWVMVALRNGTWIPSFASRARGGHPTRSHATRDVARIRSTMLRNPINPPAPPVAIVKSSVDIDKPST